MPDDEFLLAPLVVVVDNPAVRTADQQTGESGMVGVARTVTSPTSPPMAPGCGSRVSRTRPKRAQRRVRIAMYTAMPIGSSTITAAEPIPMAPRSANSAAPITTGTISAAANSPVKLQPSVR